MAWVMGPKMWHQRHRKQWKLYTLVIKKVKNFHVSQDILMRVKGQLEVGRNIYKPEACYGFKMPRTQFKSGPKIWTDISLKTTYKWPTANEKMLNTTNTREMEIRTTMRCLVIQVTMAIIIKPMGSEVISKNGAQDTWPRKPHKSCRSRGSNLCVHFKNTRETTQAIKCMRIWKATKYLKDVTVNKRCVPFHHSSVELIGVHRPNSGAGRRVSDQKKVPNFYCTCSRTCRECWT